ncbi:MAG: RIP metalloprotease RseP [Hyphomicrobiales bacterium]|nr:RIP metalloprotease RseP [Hyphomicrobiales bacterium]
MLQAFYSTGIYIVPFVFVLTVVVFFHELGHFLVGRWCGIKVDAFSIGFGKELFAFIDRKGTRWRVALLPLGGYVRFHGDANGASMADDSTISAMPEEERKVTFAAAALWKRAAVVAAGPIANFILAIVILTGVFYVYGRAVLTPRVGGVQPGSAAEIAGFQTGDLVLEINGEKINDFNELQRIVSAAPDQTLRILVDRHGVGVPLQATPRLKEVTTPVGTARVGQLGIQAGANREDWRIESYGLGESVKLACGETWYVFAGTAKYLGQLVTGRESADQLSGPVGLAQASGEMAKLGFSALLNLLAILSISIGLLNLAPVPLLDGGHLLFYAIEAIRGRALPERAQEIGFRIGIALVGCLMIVATYNDIQMRILPLIKRMLPG